MARGSRYEYVSIDKEIDAPLPFKQGQKRVDHISGVEYILNSLGFRSDEFTDNHNGEHILFMGCSVTYGTGVPLEQTWSKLLYNKMSESRKLSGYFNLSFPGAASTEIIFNAMKYIKKFGAPKEIYFMLPEIMRGIHMEKSSALLHSIQMYTMFEEYCKIKGIRLVSFTWDLEDISEGYIQTANDFYERFDTFNKIDYDQFSKSLYDYAYEHQKEPFLLYAADKQHHGTAHNYGFYKTILDIMGGKQWTLILNQE